MSWWNWAEIVHTNTVRMLTRLMKVVYWCPLQLDENQNDLLLANPRFALNGNEMLSLFSVDYYGCEVCFDGSVIDNSSVVSASEYWSLGRRKACSKDGGELISVFSANMVDLGDISCFVQN